MKKSNIFFTLAILFLSLLSPMINAQTQTEVIVKKFIRFYNVSDNGKYAVGNIGTDVGLVYSLERDQYIYLTGESGDVSSQANDVTDDGIVFGSYLKQPAYFEIDWEENEAIGFTLPMPEPAFDENFDNVIVWSVTPDGKFASGEATLFKDGTGGEDPFFGAIPLKWDFTNGKNNATVEAFELHDKFVGEQFRYINVDGTRFTGRATRDFGNKPIQQYAAAVWGPGDTFKLLDTEMLKEGCFDDTEILGATTTLGLIAGEYTEDIKGADGSSYNVYYPFLYNDKTGEFKKYKEYEGSYFMGVSDDGNLITSANGKGGTPFNGNAEVFYNGKLYDLGDWLVEFYQCDAMQKGWVVTGMPLACTPDGKTIIGTGYVIDNESPSGQAICGYMIKLGEMKICPQPTNLISEVIGNSTVVLNWNAPEKYEAELSGYNVYKDGEKINESLLTEMTFTDELTNVGKYCYTVDAVYSDGCNSGKCDEVCIEIYAQGSCYPPNQIEGFATGDDYNSVKIFWEYPDFDLIYCKSKSPFNGFNIENNEPFYFANKWAKEDIESKGIDGYNITAVSFYINAKADYDFVLFTSEDQHSWEDNDKSSTILYRENIALKSDFEVGGKFEQLYDKYATFELNEIQSLDKTKNYYIAIYCKNYDNATFPAVYDNGPLTSMWKSDIYAFDFDEDKGEHARWLSMRYVNGVTANFNWILSARVSTISGEISKPVDNVPSIYDPMVESYTVLRNDENIATVYTNEYTDNSFGGGSIDQTYNYKVVANYKYACESDPSDVLSLRRDGISEVLQSDVKIYPNPVENGYFTIDSQYDNMIISDVQGRIVFSTDKQINNVNINNLKSGIYFVKLNIDGKTIVKKLLVK